MRSLLLAYVLSAGCSTAKPADPGPTCAQVVDNLVLIFGASLPGHDGMQLIDRGQEIARCEQRAMSRDERVCLHQAKDKTDLARCGRFRRRDREVAPLRAAPSPGHGSASAGSANDGHGSASAGSANDGRGSASAGSANDGHGSASAGSASAGSATDGHGSASAGSANDGHGSASAGSANGGRGSAGPASGR